MRSFLLTATAVSALATSSAFAADLPAAAPVVVVAPFTWTGCYVGAEAGYGWGQEQNNFGYPLYEGRFLTAAPVGTRPKELATVGALVDPGDFNVGGVKGGVRAGCNYQVNQFVIGGVADFEASGINGSTTRLWPSRITFGEFSHLEGLGYSHLSMQNNWQGSIRANVGWAFDRLLVYATGGAAYADINSSWAITDPCADYFPTRNPYNCAAYITGALPQVRGIGTYNTGWLAGSQTNTVWGWTLGGGVEYAIDNHWSLTGEVRYVSYPKSDFALPTAFYTRFYPTAGYYLGGYNAGFNEILAQVGINYRF